MAVVDGGNVWTMDRGGVTDVDGDDDVDDDDADDEFVLLFLLL